MISIIICSRISSVPESLSANIAETIGVPYEVISIDNSLNKYSIFEAYNLGIQKSNFQYLCFIHDDIQFITKDWGELLVKSFVDNQQLGIIGLAGAANKSKAPSGWWGSGDNIINIIEHLPGKTPTFTSRGWEDGQKLKEAVVIDGVFMGIRKDKYIRFNTKLGGFHNYDQSICIDYISNGYKVYVTKEILIKHFSAGTIDKRWINSTYKFHKLYANHLPIINNDKIKKSIEVNNFVNFIQLCFNFKEKKIAIYYWAKWLFFKPVSKYHLKFLKRLLFE
jgi:hypothetical protein